MSVSREAFERIRRDCVYPPKPSASLVALVRPELKGRTIYCDPNPQLIQQLIETGRAEVER